MTKRRGQPRLFVVAKLQFKRDVERRPLFSLPKVGKVRKRSLATLPHALFATATTATATDARENEDEPHKVATIASAKARSATAVVEQEHKQDNVAWIAATSVCTTVCKESVHLCTSFIFGLLLHHLTQVLKIVLLGIYLIDIKYIFVWIISSE